MRLRVRDGDIRSHFTADPFLPEEWSESGSDGGVQRVSCCCGQCHKGRGEWAG
jgi:hypothetical protein